MHNKGCVFLLVFLISQGAFSTVLLAEGLNEHDERPLKEFVVSCEKQIERLKKVCPQKKPLIEKFSALCSKETYLEGDPSKMMVLSSVGAAIDQFEKNPNGCGE